MVDGGPAEGVEGIKLGTHHYRAPELLCGWPAFGVAVDSWSLGMTLAGCAGYRAHEGADTVPDLRARHVELSGFADHPDLRGWPAALGGDPQGSLPKPLPREALQRLGVLGADLLYKLLRLAPSLRWPAGSVATHPAAAPHATCLSAVTRSGWVGPKKDEPGEVEPQGFPRAPEGYGGLVPQFVVGPHAGGERQRDAGPGRQAPFQHSLWDLGAGSFGPLAG